MEITHLQHHQIDPGKWDACIRASLQTVPYADTWYLDLVNPGWEALVAGNYQIVFPLPAKSKMGISYLAQPWFTQQLGLFSIDEIDNQTVNSFLGQLPLKFRLAEINLNIHNPAGTSGFASYPNLTYELSLDKSYDQLYAEFSENTRRNLRKAAGFPLSHGEVTPSDLIRLFRENRGKQVRNLREPQFHLLRKIISTSSARGCGALYGVLDGNGNPCAAAFFLYGHGKVVFLFSGNNDKSREVGAMFLLFDKFIRDHAGSNLVLDFEGSNDPNLARFYRGFGSQEKTYYQVRMNRLYRPARILLKTLKELRKML